MSTAIVLVALGGMCGGVMRLFLSRRLPPLWGTFCANVVACALLGWATSTAESPFFLAAGLAGALSTWSTLAKEVGTLPLRKACVYLALTLLAGTAAMWIAIS
ncbi:CrcB family protein [Corynebacterium sp. H128]|uniref:fluoride efflux transporter FluC n=1 Tax=unclassified Corynebacterium TaxID=2624378 RepID=UPI0030B53CED